MYCSAAPGGPRVAEIRFRAHVWPASTECAPPTWPSSATNWPNRPDVGRFRVDGGMCVRGRLQKPSPPPRGGAKSTSAERIASDGTEGIRNIIWDHIHQDRVRRRARALRWRRHHRALVSSPQKVEFEDRTLAARGRRRRLRDARASADIRCLRSAPFGGVKHIWLANAPLAKFTPSKRRLV